MCRKITNRGGIAFNFACLEANSLAKNRGFRREKRGPMTCQFDSGLTVR
ncbi:hypothetical protein RMSM_03453 [Rhodopirellula maiorica SM1]|uniref:Uncharacterized protein n=1 Tax=Rhodopirellula maiorica SM1 TaxID=1265738 RepID=M5RJW7_9BACT|nr:hypothetical protein RMSM_03453 [Rhodopirellula maiorica SM1]